MWKNLSVFQWTKGNVIEYHSFLKEENPVTYDSMDESEGHYTKWHKPGTKAIDYDLSYILDLKQSNS
jgi:hypothetical protein